MPTLLDALRAHLIAEGVGRDPRVAGPLPPIWREPAALNAPGEGNTTEAGTNAVIGLFETTGIPSGSFESWREQPVVDVWVRARTSPLAKSTLKQVRDALIGRRVAPSVGWDMGGLPVIEVREWRAPQPISPPVPADQGSIFHFGSSYLFELYA